MKSSIFQKIPYLKGFREIVLTFCSYPVGFGAKLTHFFHTPSFFMLKFVLGMKFFTGYDICGVRDYVISSIYVYLRLLLPILHYLQILNLTVLANKIHAVHFLFWSGYKFLFHNSIHC